MVLYEDPFKVTFNKRQLVPLVVSYADSTTVTVNPTGATPPPTPPPPPSAPGTAAGVISTIQVVDLITNVWYTWLKNTQYPTGYWVNNYGSLPAGATNANPGQTPYVTSGSNSLFLYFLCINNGAATGNLTLTIKNSTSGATLATQVISTDPNAGAEAYVTISMPSTPINIIFAVIP
jgi:hypothetical protein